MVYIFNLTLVLTNRCNLKCVYCYEHNSFSAELAKAKDITPKIIDRALPEILKYVPSGVILPRARASDRSGILTVYLWGGEPLLRKDLIRHTIQVGTRVAKEQNKVIDWRISTNGVLIDDEAAELLKDVQVFLSIDDAGLGQSVTRGTTSTFIKEKPWTKLGDLKKVVACIVHYPAYVRGFLVEQVQSLIDIGFYRFDIVIARGYGWSQEDFDLFGEQFGKLIQWHFDGKILLVNMKAFVDDLEVQNTKIWTGDKLAVALATDGTLYPSDLEMAMKIAPIGDAKRIDEETLTRIARLKSYLVDSDDMCKGCIAKSHCYAYGCILYHKVTETPVPLYYQDACAETQARWRALYRVVRGEDWKYENNQSLVDAYRQV